MSEQDQPRRVYKAAHRRPEPGDLPLTAPAIMGEVVEAATPLLPPDMERLLVEYVRTGNLLLAARAIGMADERAKQIQRTRLWADALRWAFAEAKVTPQAIADLIFQAMNATYPKLVKVGKGRRERIETPHWTARLAAAKLYLSTHLELGKLERLPDGEEQATAVRRQLVTTGEIAGKSRAEVLALIDARAGRRHA